MIRYKCRKCGEEFEHHGYMGGEVVPCPNCHRFHTVAPLKPHQRKVTPLKQHQRKVAVTGACLVFSGLAFAVSSFIAFGTGTTFTLFLTFSFGVVFACAAVVATVLIICKHNDVDVWGPLAAALVIALLGSLGTVCAVGYWMPKKEFGPLAAEYTRPYQEAYERYLAEPSSEDRIDKSLHGKKLVICDYDEEKESLEPTGERVLVEARAEHTEDVDFVVVRHETPKGILVTALHVPTRRLKSMRLIPWRYERRTEHVMPTPGGGVEYVDEKVGPFGRRHHTDREYPSKDIVRYVKSVILD